MLQASTYQLWHGIIPMADFRRTADPDEFLVGGERGYAIDRLGRRYLDARSAMWNVTLGYSCEPVKEAMRRQLDELPSGTILRFESVPDVAVRYAEALAGSLPDPLNYVRFGNTGSQLTEAAVMLSRFYRRMTGERDRNHVIALDGSYHGSGPLASALSGEPVIHDYSAPLDDHVRHIVRPAPGGCGTDDAAPCDGGCVRPLVDLVGGLGAERVTAMIVEPVLGSHVLPLTGHYLTRVAAECRSRGIHFIADEVTTGAGRTGAMTASERAGLTPDMMVLGKGISAGYFPLAALAVSESIFAALAGPGRPLNFPHGSTTDGHPIGMAAGLAVLDIITADGFFEGVRETGHFLRDLIVESFSARAEVAAVRGRGLMLGVEFVHDDGSAWDVYDIDDLRRTCRDHGLLTSVAHNLLPLLPPLTISRDECVELVDRLGRSLDELRKRGTTGAKARGKTDGRRR